MALIAANSEGCELMKPLLELGQTDLFDVIAD